MGGYAQPFRIEKIILLRQAFDTTLDISGGLEKLGDCLEEVVEHLAKVTRVLYPDLPAHTYVDGSHIVRNRVKGKNIKYGEGGGTVQAYSDFIPQLMFYLEQGSMIVFDNGGAVKEILDDIREHGMEYTTRVKMNLSDDEKIANHRNEMVYVCRETACIMSGFDSSDRTNYLFFSVDRYILGSYAEDRKQERNKSQKEIAKNAIERNDLRGLVKFIKNDYVKVTIEKYVIQEKLDLLDDSESIQTGSRCG